MQQGQPKPAAKLAEKKLPEREAVGQTGFYCFIYEKELKGKAFMGSFGRSAQCAMGLLL